MSDLLHVAYFSENRITREDAGLIEEINTILRVSQRNNARDGVTGALVFNRGVFGQVLEGPSRAVETIFERIQMDTRHANVTVLDLAPIERRFFSEWSMGFIGDEDKLEAQFRAVTGAPTAELPNLSGHEMLDILTRLARENELSATAGV